MRNRIGKYVLGILGCCLLTAWGWVQYHAGRSEREFNTAIRDAAQWDLATSLGALAEGHAVPEGAVNGFDLLVTAHDAVDWSLTDDPAVSDAISHVKRPLPGRRLPPEVRAAALRFLESNRGPIGRLRQAVREPVFRVSIPIGGAGAELADSLRHVRFALNNARKALVLYIDLAIDEREFDRAIDGFEDLFGLSTHLMQQPLCVLYSEGAACDYWGMAALVRLLENAPLHDAQWKRLDALFAARIAHLDITRAYWGDFLINDRDKRATGRRWGRSALERMVRGETIEDMAAGTFYAFYELSDVRQRDRLYELKTTLDWVRVLQMPAPDALDYLERHRNRSEFGPYGLGPLFVMHAEYAWGGPVFIREHHAAYLTSYRLLAAITRYARARGAWPVGVEQLAPEYLESVPVDPFTQAPFRYREGENDIAIVGIGSEKLRIDSTMRKPDL